MPELFSANAELIDGETTYRGRDQIGAAYTQSKAGRDRAPRRHLVTNTFIELIDATSARGICYVTEVDASGSVCRVGHCEDRFALSDGEWLFDRRRLHWLTPS